MLSTMSLTFLCVLEEHTANFTPAPSAASTSCPPHVYIVYWMLPTTRPMPSSSHLSARACLALESVS